MKALSLAVAAATTLVTSIASAQTPQSKDDAGVTALPAPAPPASSQAPAGEPLPQLPQSVPSVAVPATPSSGSASAAPASGSASAAPSTIAETQLGGRGESCRARADCKTGLACFDNVCALPSDRKACSEDSECGELACVHGTCSAHPRAVEPATTRTTFDLDETFSTRSTVSAYFGPSGFGYAQPSYAATETTASTILGVHHRVGSFELEGAIPFALQGRTNDTLTGAFGNLAVGGYYARETENVRFRVGGGVAFPTTGTSAAAQRAEASAAYSRGLDRVWLWSPNVIALTPGVLIGSRLDAVFQHATEAVLAPVVPMGRTSGTGTVVVQISEDLGAHVGLFRGGARAELVTTTTSGTQAQVSVLPYVGVDGPSGFADIGLLINLAEPSGFSFDQTKYWGLRLRGGLRF